jgi:hypothetical protein
MTFHLAVKPAIRTADCRQLIRYGFLNECKIANALIDCCAKGPKLPGCWRITVYSELTGDFRLTNQAVSGPGWGAHQERDVVHFIDDLAN